MSGSVFVCSFESCAKSFKKKSRLEAHIRSHTGEKPYVCVYDDCDKKYSRAAHLKRHEESVHQGGAGRKDIYRRSNSASRSGDEEESHPKQYKCEYDGCGKVFKKHKLLKSHISCVHSEVKEYKCPYDGCGKLFWCASKLRCHIKIHKGYKCDVEGCDAILPKWTLLRKHKMLEHKSGESECSICGKTFRHRTWLKQHMILHDEGRALYECPRDNCDRSYLDLRNLNAHIRSYHDGKRFPCTHPGCDRTFTTKQKQLQHQGLHDPNRPPPKKRVNKGGRKRNIAATLSGHNPKIMLEDCQLPPYDPDDVISMEDVEEPEPEPMDQDDRFGLFSGYFTSGVRERERQTNSKDLQLLPKDSSTTCSTHTTLPVQAAFACGDNCESTGVLHSSVGSHPFSTLEKASSVPSSSLEELSVASSSAAEGPSVPMSICDAPFSMQPSHTQGTESSAEILKLDNFRVNTGQHLPICALCGELEEKCSESCANSTANVAHHINGGQSMTTQALFEKPQETPGSFALHGGGHAQTAGMEGVEENWEPGNDQGVISEQLHFSDDLITEAIIYLAEQY